jgi:hypothetical protein
MSARSDVRRATGYRASEESEVLFFDRNIREKLLASAIHRTVNAAMIDTIINRAPDRARRAAWAGVMERAAAFAA